jgi:hypothetical protein
MTSTKLLWTAAAIAFPLSMAQAQAPASTSSAAVAADASVPTTETEQSTVGDADASASDAATTGGTATTESTTTADSASAQAPSTGQPVAVSKADVKTGATVLGSDGAAVGKIESVSADAAVVSTGRAKAQIPFTSFGKTDKGLVIAMSKTQFEAAASGKSAS